MDQYFETDISEWISRLTLHPGDEMPTIRAVHPAAVLVTALISANLLGIIGVVIAAPFPATLTLLGRHIMRKMTKTL